MAYTRLPPVTVSTFCLYFVSISFSSSSFACALTHSYVACGPLSYSCLTLASAIYCDWFMFQLDKYTYVSCCLFLPFDLSLSAVRIPTHTHGGYVPKIIDFTWSWVSFKSRIYWRSETNRRMEIQKRNIRLCFFSCIFNIFLRISFINTALCQW